MSVLSRSCVVLAWILASLVGACSKPAQLAPFHILDLRADGSAWEGDRIVCLSATPESNPLRDHLRIVAESMPQAPMIPNADTRSVPDGCLELRFQRETPMSSLSEVTQICTEFQIWRLSLVIEGRPALPYRLPKDIGAGCYRTPEQKLAHVICIRREKEEAPSSSDWLERAWSLSWRVSESEMDPVFVSHEVNGARELGRALVLLHTTWPERDAEIDLPGPAPVGHCLDLVELTRRSGFPAVRFAQGWVEF